ncbi:hypothetical protein Hbor_15950 [Halogeometricum borinquense DSM 11551]|uniref:Uncharacterized protein n=1 Tax=Halogeometricum borinquense (strain ATCC 700274 / DSM 11551 / JCM 10706 / KCTC 4070 / PR3) TaxID=469382 RepID=E4NL13_HALBP|nr:hypothetical protein Hbor_15950 [Halogeometricum borinquense DSM 11551]
MLWSNAVQKENEGSVGVAPAGYARTTRAATLSAPEEACHRHRPTTQTGANVIGKRRRSGNFYVTPIREHGRGKSRPNGS